MFFDESFYDYADDYSDDHIYIGGVRYDIYVVCLLFKYENEQGFGL